MNRTHTPLAVLMLSLAALDASAQAAPYTIGKNSVASAMQPDIRLEIDSALSYVGSQRWILYGVAQAEQHLFAQKVNGTLARFVWIQFEEYLPSNTHSYDYSRSTPISAFGRELRVDKSLVDVPTTEARPESDGAHARAMLREKGFAFPAQMLSERFIYLPDSLHRRELMVIYMEDPRLAGVTEPLQRSAEKKPMLDVLLATHERKALATFRIAPAK